MIFENDKIGDGHWSPHVAKTLRDLADIIDAKRGLRGSLAERYETSDGTCVTILSGTWLGELLSLQDGPSESQDQTQKQTWRQCFVEGQGRCLHPDYRLFPGLRRSSRP